MKIDSWDIVQADARQWNVTPGFHEMKNDSEWTRGSPVPVMMRNEIGFKPLSVRVLIKADGGRQAILARASEILSHLVEPVDLELDGFPHKYHAVLTGHKYEETAKQHFHALTMDFDCFEYGDEVVQEFSGQTELAVTNPGNILTPVIVEVTPQIGMAFVVLTGLCRDPVTGADLPIRLGDVETSKTVTIDGETGLVTQDGELKENVEFWGIPTLLPGENRITVDSNRMDVKVRFRPRFM